MEKLWKVFLGGKPKSAGKSTFALTAPGKKLVLQYDLGDTTAPPGVDPATIWVRKYDAAILNPSFDKEGHLTSDKWQRPSNVGEAIIKDLYILRQAFLRGEPEFQLTDGKMYPRPDTIILDGMTEMPLILVDWILAVNKLRDADEFIGDSGKVNKYKLWQKRIDVMRPLLHSVIQLPCNVVLIAWEIAEMKDDRLTGQTVPDIGGKLDNMIPGKVDAALRCFARYENSSVRYMVQAVPDGLREWVGVRGKYGMKNEIDVTIHPGKVEKLPWDRVLGE